jgi:hypothetical protein
MSRNRSNLAPEYHAFPPVSLFAEGRSALRPLATQGVMRETMPL